MKKRGLSPIIATVLILLLTVAAISLIASYLIPFIKKTLTLGTECINYREYFKFEDSFGYNCFNSTNNLHGVSIKTNVQGLAEKDTEGLGLALIFTDDLTSKKVEIKDNGSIEQIKILGPIAPLEVVKPGEILTYVYNGTPNLYTKVEAYAILKSGRICDKSDEINLVPCTKKLA